MTILERPLYGLVKIETSPWSNTLVWTDRTANLVEGFNYSIGGRIGNPGSSQVDVGTLNATFKNLPTVPNVGSFVRISADATGAYPFVGYIQDISQRVIYTKSTSLTAPVTLTTLNVVDWVGYISQFRATGIGGISVAFAREDNYNFLSRARALNNVVDPTNATQMIAAVATTAPAATLGDTDYIGTLADHIDLAVVTQNAYWYPTQLLPTNITTGRGTFVVIRPLNEAPSSGKTFTDLAGTAGQLHYTEIDLESSSQNVANTILLNNFSVITATSPAPLYNKKLISQIGGANKPNYAIVDGKEIVSVPYEANWTLSDATSITTYGNRATEINTNLAGIVEAANLASNPSAEYSDTGYGSGANTIVRRRKPVDIDPTFNAYDGEWAIRMRQQTAALTGAVQFNGAESDGTPIIPGQTYYASAWAARGNPSSNNARARVYIRWLDDSETIVASATGTQVSLTNQNQWYQATVSGVAPAGASRARVNVEFQRATATNINVGEVYWVDALYLSEQNVAYFDGDSSSTTSHIHLWTGELGLSPSFKVTNNLDDTIQTYLTRYSTTSNRVTRIRWNAQEDLDSVRSLRVGFTISIIFKGTTTTYRIVGIDGNVSPDRYMIDYYLEKV